jgi:hypothetical protein
MERRTQEPALRAYRAKTDLKATNLQSKIEMNI